jgi:metal-responsive CopG/Arc/MetJ family transcriptional regulator
MKTAITIPAEVLTAAERTAKRLGLSRSEFFTLAARRMIRKVEGRKLTNKINAALKGVDSIVDKELAQMQSAALADERW